MKILVTGGTGFVGRTAVRFLAREGHEVTVLTRRAGRGAPQPEGVGLLEGDPREKGAWQERAAEHEAVLNLAGASIFRRWTASAKREMHASRILSTRHVVEALARRKEPARVFLSASGTGYYGFRGDEEVDENAPAGSDFLSGLSREWEREAQRAEEQGVRVVLCRLGVVLGREGGALRKMLPAFRAGLASPLGSGDQWFPWVHQEDLARVFAFLLERNDLRGPVNCTAPHAVRNREFTRALAGAVRRPAFLPAVPGFAMKTLLGEMALVLLEGQRAVPRKLSDAGFTFRHGELHEALADLLAR